MIKNKEKKMYMIALIISLIIILTIGVGLVKSDSMVPVLNKGTIVVYSKVFYESSLKEGDIILFKDNERLICHRIIDRRKEYVITKGDNLLDADPPVLNEDIVGKVLFHVL